MIAEALATAASLVVRAASFALDEAERRGRAFDERARARASMFRTFAEKIAEFETEDRARRKREAETYGDEGQGVP